MQDEEVEVAECDESFIPPQTVVFILQKISFRTTVFFS